MPGTDRGGEYHHHEPPAGHAPDDHQRDEHLDLDEQQPTVDADDVHHDGHGASDDHELDPTPDDDDLDPTSDDDELDPASDDHELDPTSDDDDLDPRSDDDQHELATTDDDEYEPTTADDFEHEPAANHVEHDERTHDEHDDDDGTAVRLPRQVVQGHVPSRAALCGAARSLHLRPVAAASAGRGLALRASAETRYQPGRRPA
jgi:hypothetical protein